MMLITRYLGATWYIPHWAARQCAENEHDPTAVLARIPRWWRALTNDCHIADVVVHACWGR
jgi:hypothetical protein